MGAGLFGMLVEVVKPIEKRSPDSGPWCVVLSCVPSRREFGYEFLPEVLARHLRQELPLFGLASLGPRGPGSKMYLELLWGPGPRALDPSWIRDPRPRELRSLRRWFQSQQSRPPVSANKIT